MRGKVLVVDDEEMMTTVISECLELGGYEPLVALSGEEGLRLLREHRPGLVITDMRMPEMDGYEFVSLVRKEHDVPVIMLTGMTYPDPRLEGSGLVDAYLPKPVTMRELLGNVEALLNAPAGARSAS